MTMHPKVPGSQPRKSIYPETLRISIPTCIFFILAFSACKLLYELGAGGDLVIRFAKDFSQLAPVLQKRYVFSIEAFGSSAAAWQVLFMFVMMVTFIFSIVYSVAVPFTRNEIQQIRARYSPQRFGSLVALMAFCFVAGGIMFLTVVVPWMPRLVTSMSGVGPLYRVVPAGVSWTNALDACLLYLLSQMGVMIRGIILIITDTKPTGKKSER